jgi:hypothetical protein
MCVLASYTLGKRSASHVGPLLWRTDIVSGGEGIADRRQNNHADVVVGIGGRESMVHLLGHQA